MFLELKLGLGRLKDGLLVVCSSWLLVLLGTLARSLNLLRFLDLKLGLLEVSLEFKSSSTLSFFNSMVTGSILDGDPRILDLNLCLGALEPTG